MKKKIKIWAMASLLIAVFSNSAFADSDMDDNTWGDKLNRGLLNIVSSPVEIARSIHGGNQKEGYAYGWTVGLVQGLGRTFLRLGSGVIELVTFPFDFPKDDKSPLIKPAYVWQEWGEV